MDVIFSCRIIILDPFEPRPSKTQQTSCHQGKSKQALDKDDNESKDSTLLHVSYIEHADLTDDK